jgi:hypothetical protein
VKLSASIAKGDLAALVDEIAPLDIVDLAIAPRPRRVLSIGRPSTLELATGEGLRVGGDARLVWDFAGVMIPVAIRAWRLLLAPKVVLLEGAPALAFEPKLEALEIGNAPRFVQDRVADFIDGVLAAKGKKLVWPFGRQLMWRRSLSERVSPPTRFDLVPIEAAMKISTHAISFTIDFDAHFVREARDRDTLESCVRGVRRLRMPNMV